MKNKLLIIMTAVMAIILLAILARPIPKHIEVGKSDTVTIVKHDTILYTDTFTIYEPKPIKVETIKMDTVYLKDSTKVELPIETKLYKDSLCQEGDTIFQELLIQGINAKVLYAKVLLKKQFIHQNSQTIITNHIEKKKKKSFSDHFYVGMGYTVGYDPFNKRLGQVVGLSAGIKF